MVDRRRTWSEQMEATLRTMLAAGASDMDIAARLKVTRDAVYNKILREGLRAPATRPWTVKLPPRIAVPRAGKVTLPPL